MKSNIAESIEDQGEVIRGIEPHPEFSTYSDPNLELRQGLIDQKIAWAKEDCDDFAVNWYEVEMALLHAERARRNGGKNSSNSSPLPAKLILKAEALYGLVGRIVEAIGPYSESDPVAILTNVLTAFGNIVGPIPYFRVEHTHHYLNLFNVHVGDTSKGRKGVAWSTPRRMFRDIDGAWQTAGGLSSGEGLVYAVRDERKEKKPIREKGRVVDYEYVLVNEGASDKRLLLIEEEFSQALKVMSREGNILSPIIRQAWDGLTLSPLTKNNPLKATGSHISIIGHITRMELLRHLNDTEQSNGFGNRFCWFLVSRSKCIATPDGVPEEKLIRLIEELRDAVYFARKVAEMRRDEKAEQEWQSVYPTLSEGKPGLVGFMISRAEAQVMRMACLYALLDKSDVVRVEHIEAALALWDYSEASVKAIFGDQSGDPNVDTAKAALKAKGELTLTEMHAIFGRNVTAAEIERVISVLIKGGVATIETVPNDKSGRSITVLRWVTN